MSYKAVYKCRLCGEIYRNGATAGEAIAEARMIELHLGICGTVPGSMALSMTETHHCGGPHAGSLGMADFQGWEMEN